MADIDLKIVTNLSKFVKEFRDAQVAVNKFDSELKRRLREEKEVLRQQELAVKRLRDAFESAAPGKAKQQALEQLKRARKDAAITQKDVESMSAALENADKKVNKLSGTLKKYLGVTALAVTAYKAFKAVIASTTTATEAFDRAVAGVKASLDVLAKSFASGDFSKLGERMREARRAAQDYSDALAEISKEERALMLQRSKTEAELKGLEAKMIETGVSPEEREKALNEWIEIQTKFANQEREIANKRLDAASKAVGARVKLDNKELQELIIRYNENKSIMELSLEYEEKYVNALLRLRKVENTFPVKEGTINARLRKMVRNMEGKRLDEMRAAIEENHRLLQERIKNETDLSEAEVAEYAKRVKNLGLANKKELDLVADAMKKKFEADAIENELQAKTQRRRNMIEEAKRRDAEKAAAERKRLQDELLKGDEEFYKRLNQLKESNEQARIGMMEGEMQILVQLMHERKNLLNMEETMLKEFHERARREKELGIIDEAEMERRLKITKLDEIHQAIELLTQEAQAKIAELLKRSRKELLDEEEKDDAERLRYIREREMTELELVDASEVAKLELKLKYLREDRDNLKHENAEVLEAMRLAMDELIKLVEKQIKIFKSKSKEFSLAKLLGIDEKYIDATRTAARELTRVLDDIFAQRVRDAERTRSLLDRQIQETQMAMNAELALLEAGYASNVRAKQDEIAKLQQVRQKALQEEEAAIKAKNALDTIQQISSLVTASANIYSSLSVLPGGIALASTIIAAMFAGFLKAKAEAAKVTLAKGGLIDEYGEVKGKRHSQGGERLLDHVEVEGGEKIGVFNRLASKKFDKQIRFAVEEFNDGRIPIFKTPAGTQIVNNNMDIRKLHDIDDKLAVLNEFFQRNGIVTYSGNTRIETRKNHTRVIRNG